MLCLLSPPLSAQSYLFSAQNLSSTLVHRKPERHLLL